MSRRALVLDGLWFSLCPSFTTASRSTTFHKHSRSLRISRSPPISIVNSTSRRYYSNTFGENPNPTQYPDISNPQIPRNLNSNENSEQDAASPSQKTRREHMRPRKSWHPRSYHKVQDDLLKKPDSALEALLQYMADKQPNLRHTTQVLRLLILANTDCERGSPAIVRGLLEEMEENGITADSGTLHGALQVSDGDSFATA
jgi:hypothetical protein